jgi:RNA polymerase sigma factor (sigma-70 family)
MSKDRPVERAVRAEDHIGLVRAVVYRFCRKGRLEDSDLYSIGCVALMEAASSFDPSKSKFCTWATRIIRQRVIDEVRKYRKEMESADEDAVESAACPPASPPVHIVSAIVGADDSDSKSEAAGKEVLKRYYLDGLSMSKLGLELGISKEGVRKRINSALSMARRKNRLLLENTI